METNNTTLLPVPPEQNPANSSDAFFAEVAIPTQPALDTPVAGADGAAAPNIPPPPPSEPYVPPVGAPPVFTDIPGDIGGNGTAAADVPPVDTGKSAAWKDSLVKGLISMENYFSAQGMAAIAGHDSTDPFRASDEEMKELFIAAEPFKDWIAEKCPRGLPLLLIYGGIKTNQVRKAFKFRKVNRANAAAKQDPEAMKTVATSGKNEVRTNFKLYGKTYRNSPSGTYIKREDTDRLNQPDMLPQMKDIAAICDANSMADVMKCFDLKQADIAKYYDAE